VSFERLRLLLLLLLQQLLCLTTNPAIAGARCQQLLAAVLQLSE
jgi:hypothetical protein